MWISNVDRPGHGLMQIVVSDVRLWRTITRLLVWVAWLPIAWVWQITWVYSSGSVFNLNCNRWDTVSPCDNHLWNVLTRFNLITLWNLRINSNMLGRLTIQIRMANFNIIIVGISINNLTCLRIRIINKFVTIIAANKRITDRHIIGDFLRLSSFKPIN